MCPPLHVSGCEIALLLAKSPRHNILPCLTWYWTFLLKSIDSCFEGGIQVAFCLWKNLNYLRKTFLKKIPRELHFWPWLNLYILYVVGKVGSQVNPEFSSSPLNHNYLPGSKLMLNVGIK